MCVNRGLGEGWDRQRRALQGISHTRIIDLRSKPLLSQNKKNNYNYFKCVCIFCLLLRIVVLILLNNRSKASMNLFAIQYLRNHQIFFRTSSYGIRYVILVEKSCTIISQHMLAGYNRQQWVASTDYRLAYTKWYQLLSNNAKTYLITKFGLQI